MEPQRIHDILETAVQSTPTKGLVIYPQGDTNSAIEISYRDLFEKARQYGLLLKYINGYRLGAPVVIYLNDHLDTLFWFWATIYADGIPTILPPFSNIAVQKDSQIEGLVKTLEQPFAITRQGMLDVFQGHVGLQLHTIESLLAQKKDTLRPDNVPILGKPREDDLAMLMLTSGSTGNAKAVRLTHKQVIAAVKGKAFFRRLPAGKPFLNWIGLDHVASMVEIHLPAMFLGEDQVHVQAVDVVSTPTLFLDLLSRHQVARTFAPNFFMAKLISTVRPEGEATLHEDWNLRSLTWMGSGGEANDVDVSVGLTSLFKKCGARPDVIVPGFGMTETCAGCIYNLDCPRYDIEQQNVFTSLGECIPGAQMRVTVPSEHACLDCCNCRRLAEPNEPGSLEVQGAVVFDGYYNNPLATAEAFAAGNWFKTGDQAIVDYKGRLQMIGRAKETLNINGVKHLPQDIEGEIEQALPPDTVSRIVCFPFRLHGAQTESICIAYLANERRTALPYLTIHDLIVQRVMLQTGTQARVLALDNETSLPKSTLGKVSRAKMRSMLESGLFADQICLYDERLASSRLNLISYTRGREMVMTEAERLLLEDFAIVLGTKQAWQVDAHIFDLGATSIDLIRLKMRVGSRLGMEIPILTLMMNPSARMLAAALQSFILSPDSTSDIGSAPDSGSESLQSSITYNPVVTLRSSSPGASKTPLWLIHPGVGEVLVFLGLVQHLSDRPVHALRARGFEPGEVYFSSIEEAVEVYYSAVIRMQPAGPYALAGYSYGSMLAFELAKRLEREGSEVRFLGCFNLPPHIKWRMRQLSWAACLLNLSYFLSLVNEDEAGDMEPSIEALDASGDREGALRTVLARCDAERLAELQLSSEALQNWAMLAHKLQAMARDYEPQGSVAVMDVFHAIPLREAAKDRDDWVTNHLGKWREFVRTEPGFHAVGGAHYTMLGAEHVQSFVVKLSETLSERGL